MQKVNIITVTNFFMIAHISLIHPTKLSFENFIILINQSILSKQTTRRESVGVFQCALNENSIKLVKITLKLSKES